MKEAGVGRRGGQCARVSYAHWSLLGPINGEEDVRKTWSMTRMDERNKTSHKRADADRKK